ncbi:MAG: hypothetical protein PHP45_01180 [Elusimicrobiales bacterium]|nr:hypothetical protein [Elusimicrobiales bacterium]
MHTEITYLREKLDADECRKLVNLLADGVCDYLLASRKIGIRKIVAKRAANALKTARGISVQCSENPTENALISGGNDSIM